jgi:hypothetical protein
MFPLATNSGTDCEGENAPDRLCAGKLGEPEPRPCDKHFAEKMSAKSLKGRPQLERASDALGTDGVRWSPGDRATRSMMDGIAIHRPRARPRRGGEGA